MVYIIAGLGNPDPEYADTRHNTGRMVLDYLKKEKNFSKWEKRKELKALVSEGELKGKSLLLIEPDNYMNNSGESLERLKKREEEICSRSPSEHIIVVHDDLDLPIGTLRVSFDRGSGGHNGVESIIKSLKTPAFVRIRVGISPTSSDGVIRKPKGENAVERYVLQNFTKTEREKINQVIKTAVSAIETIMEDGYDKAMREYN